MSLQFLSSFRPRHPLLHYKICVATSELPGLTITHDLQNHGQSSFKQHKLTMMLKAGPEVLIIALRRATFPSKTWFNFSRKKLTALTSFFVSYLKTSCSDKCKCKCYCSMQSQLFIIWEDYIDNQISTSKLLKNCSYLINP